MPAHFQRISDGCSKNLKYLMGDIHIYDIDIMNQRMSWLGKATGNLTALRSLGQALGSTVPHRVHPAPIEVSREEM